MHIDSGGYRGFSKSYDKPVKKLIATANILPLSSMETCLRNTPTEVKILWDTGASLTFIKPKIRDQLKLCMFKTDASATIAGVGGLFKADFTIISIQLNDYFTIEYCPVYVLDFPIDSDMIIGMDILSMGDFLVSSADKKTTFSFVVPPLPENINLADRAEKLNKQIF